MKSTRERILQKLLKTPRASINELAEVVGINSISVRHHLSSLQAEGLVTYEEERHGVGRPRLVYFLTEKGMELFPSSYFRFSNRLLEQMKESLPEKTVTKILHEMAKDIAEPYAQKAADLPLEERLDLVKEILQQEGFSVDWKKRGDQYELTEITCPYYHVSQSHPEVCAIDRTLISAILQVPIAKTRCVLKGDKTCSYVINNHQQIKEDNKHDR
ncbi:MAG: winged helix-turn-helix transcriptional regulator [Chloroflexi bacterium]|nr:winged helix-turn-helix transcriptional regulator [Chloroflexota bacterium]